jgi:hypothetical protein
MRKYGADKIALLGFLVLALLTAHLVIISKSAVKLSEPVKLICDDLSVSLPSGNGWQNESRWRYYENTFAISSIFISGRGSVTAMTNCRYLLTPPEAAADIQFRQKALAMNGTIEKTGQITAGGLSVDWALIKKQTIPLEMLFGIISLPNNRQVNIEVFQAEGNIELAERLFKNVAEGLKFKNNLLLEAGGKTVSEIKNRHISAFLNNQPYESFFIIRDEKGNSTGFTMDMFAAGQNIPLSIEGTSSFYLRRPYAQQQIISFKSDDSFDEFACRTDFGSVLGPKAAELRLDKPSAMTVIKLIPQAEKKTCRIGPAAIPEFFIDPLLSQMIDSSYKQIIVDIIEADGRIVPALISRADVPAGDEEDTEHLLNMEILDGRGFSQKMYLNAQKQILKILLRQKDLYVLEKTDLENIVKEFPEQAGYVLKQSRLLKQDKP